MYNPEIDFAKRVIALGFATREQLQECINIQRYYRGQGREFSLAKILLQKGYLNRQQLAIALRGNPDTAKTEKQPAMTKMPAEFLQNFLAKPSIGDTIARGTSTSESTATSAEQGEIPKQFGRYQIIEEIGCGGMGKVYKAYETALQRYVALKVLYQTSTREKELLRFEREAQLMAQLNHPNIIQIHDSGTVNGRFFFTMELIEGESLKEFLQKDPPLPHLVRLLIRVAQAVHYAHEQGIIHRDLKPSNIMIDDKGEPRVMDFGLARKTEVESDEEISQSQDVVGTPEYMSPEQTSGSGKEIDACSDVYSLGIILYVILTGHPPFRGDTLMNVLFQITSKEPTPPARVNRLVSRDLEAICLKAIEREKSRRYQTAKDFAADLHAYLAGNPVQARRLTTLYRLQRWTRRNRILAPLLVLMVIGLVGAIGSAVYSWVEARDSELQAIKAKHQSAEIKRQSAAKEAEVFKLTAKTNRLSDEINKAYSTIKRAWLSVSLAKVDLENRNYAAAEYKIEEIVRAAEGAEDLSLSSLPKKIEEVLAELPSLETAAEELIKQQNIEEIQEKIKNIQGGIAKIRERIGKISSEEKSLQRIFQHIHYVISFAPHIIPRSEEGRDPIYRDFPRRIPIMRGSARFEVLANWDRVIVWDRLQHKQVLQFRSQADENQYRVAAFSEDDQLLAVGLSEGEVELWDIAKNKLIGKQLLRRKGQEPLPITWILISPNKKYLFANTREAWALWEIAEMKQVFQHEEERNSHASFARDRDGEWLVISGGAKGGPGIQYTTLFNFGQSDFSYVLSHPRARIISKAQRFLPKANILLISTYSDLSIFYVGDKNRPEKMNYYLQTTQPLAHHGDVRDIAADTDKGLIASVGDDGRTILWELSNYQKICEFQHEKDARTFRTLRFFPEQEKLVMSSDYGLVEYSCYPKALHKIFQLATRNDVDRRYKNLELMKELRKSSPNRNYRQFAVAQSARKNLVAIYVFPNVFLWDWQNDTVKLVERYMLSELRELIFSEDGQYLFCCTRKYIDCWRIGDMRAMKRLSGGQCRILAPNLFVQIMDKEQSRLFSCEQGQFESGANVALHDGFTRSFYDKKTGLLIASNGSKIEQFQMESFNKQPVSATTKAIQIKDRDSGNIAGIDGIQALCAKDGIFVVGTAQGKIVWCDNTWSIIHDINVGDAIRSIHYDSQRQLYWIQTANYVFIYPKLSPQVLDPQLAKKDSDKSLSIYPLRLFAGYPIRASDIDSDFRYITLTLQDGQAMVLKIPE